MPWKEVAMKKRILLYDLETSPNVSYTWGQYQQNVLAFRKTWELLCFAYKWLGEDEVYCETREGEKSDKNLTKKLWKLLNRADVVVAHNAAEFDNKKAHAKFIEHGLTPPKPYETVDTLKIARARFLFASNKLDDLGSLLGCGRKVQTGGFDLWLKVMADDAKAWSTMVKYNKQDVALLERVYLKLRPWADKHASMATRDGVPSCPKCGSKKLQKRGLRVTTTYAYERYMCRNCWGWCRSAISNKGISKFITVNE